MQKIRVLVVDDSLTVRKRIIEVLTADPQLEVVAEAGDGATAIELCQKLRPDVITLDMMLPVMSGLAATEYIMAYCPTPILVVSASLNRGEVSKTLDALAAGAVDVLDKPTGDESDVEWEQKLRSTVKVVSRIRVITHPRARLPHVKTPPAGFAMAAPPVPAQAPAIQLVAIGASTGGPAAILEILRGLPENYPVPILLVLHLGDPFGNTFAQWLDGLSPIRAGHAKDGELLPPVGEPRVIIAPPNYHLVLQSGRLRLTKAAERNFCRPSIDVLFESLAFEHHAPWAACLLTGMGKDGADGLVAAKRAGAVTLAQDESTSVVYGMPQEAARRDAAHHILPIQAFAPALISLAEDGAVR